MVLPLKTYIESVLYREHTDWQLYLIQNWAEVVGSLHTRMCLEKIQQDTLYVGVYDPHWMHELYFLSATIVRTINARLGNNHVARVRFKLARQKQARDIRQPVQLKQENKPLPHILNEQQKHALGRIKDLELKEALQQFLFSCVHKGT